MRLCCTKSLLWWLRTLPDIEAENYRYIDLNIAEQSSMTMKELASAFDVSFTEQEQEQARRLGRPPLGVDGLVRQALDRENVDVVHLEGNHVDTDMLLESVERHLTLHASGFDACLCKGCCLERIHTVRTEDGLSLFLIWESCYG